MTPSPTLSYLSTGLLAGIASNFLLWYYKEVMAQANWQYVVVKFLRLFTGVGVSLELSPVSVRIQD
jgi:hypothetical protein